jgi:Spy/CpxP family protein refolding chaperone
MSGAKSRMSGRTRALMLLLAVFAAGVVAGVTGDRMLQPGMLYKTRLESRLPEILDRLDLTPAQRMAADSILGRSDPRVEAMMREMAPKVAAIAESVQADIRRLLTPTQAAKLDSLSGNRLLILKRSTLKGAGARVDTVYRR